MGDRGVNPVRGQVGPIGDEAGERGSAETDPLSLPFTRWR